MKVWNEVLRSPLVSLSFESREGVTWGRVLAVAKEWGLMRMVQNTGEIGPLVLFQLEDVEDIALDWRSKANLLEVMDTIDEEPQDPDTFLRTAVRSRSVVSLRLDDGALLARLEDLDGEWLEWQEFTSQGVERVRTLVPLERIRSIEADGPIERAVTNRLART